MTTTSYKVSPNLYMVQNVLPGKAEAKPAVPEAVNHVLVIDCSGSMSYELPQIRQQCKNKLPKLLSERDTVSIVWFSGRGEFGTLLEGEKVAGLTDLQKVNAAIDRWLKPVGLTGFKDPLIEVSALADRVAKANPGAFSLFFMSDGCDNQGTKADILTAVKQVAPKLNAATFVEYGYYADRPTMTAMAEAAGGQLIFSKDFNSYDAIFEGAISGVVSGGPRIEHQLPAADYVGGIVFSIDGDALIAFKPEGNKVSVPEGTSQLFFLSPTPVGKVHAYDMTYVSRVCHETPASSNALSPSYFDAVYAAISLFAARMLPEVVRPLLKATGDVGYIEQFAKCFGKQAYSQFMEDAKAATFSSVKRFQQGWDPNKVPRDDAFTALDMLFLLSQDKDIRVAFNHNAFTYSKIGRSRTDSLNVLTSDEEMQLAELSAQLQNAKTPSEASTIAQAMVAITDKPEALKFTEDAVQAAAGYPVNNLTFNESRPNVSILVTRTGTVDLASRKDRPAEVPVSMPSKIMRNYAIIKDGLVNVATLPVMLTVAAEQELRGLMTSGHLPSDAVIFNADKNVSFIQFDKMPIINAQMVKNVSAKDLFEKEYRSLQNKGRQKVLNAVFKDFGEEAVKTGSTWASNYGEAGVAWLKEQGLTEHGGFSPKSVQVEATDFYMGKELSVKIKGLSSLPTLDKAKEAMAKKKITGAVQLMAPTIEAVESVRKVSSDLASLKTWVEGEKVKAVAAARQSMYDLATIKFGVVVGQKWFEEFSSLDENSMDIEVDGTTISCTVEMKEIEIKI